MMDADSLSRVRPGKTDLEGAPAQAVELLDNVDSEEQLAQVPSEYLSGDAAKPLLSRDAAGNEYKHVLRPMLFSVVFILLVELLERLSYYGVVFTQMSYLTGQYNAEWSANMTTVQASQFVSSSVAITYSMPFLGALIADTFIGNYATILLFSVASYMPGLLLIALTAVPYLLGETFNMSALTAALLVLYPMGAGAIKACVNVMGAQQYHPVLQKKMIEAYYVNFYLAINVGALVGGMVIPVVVKSNTFAGYMIPTCCFAVAVLVFVAGSSRYVRMKPQGKENLTVLAISGKAVCGLQGLERKRASRGGRYSDVLVQSIKQLCAIIPVTLLVVPFNIAYSQMVDTFVAQGTVMADCGFVDAAWMQNFDAFAVILAGLFTGVLYPWLAKRGWSLHIATKFALGTACSALAMVCAIAVDLMIRNEYNRSGEAVSVMWQAPAFFLIGFGEIFAISSAYEAAFLIAPKNLKALSSAMNIFLIGGLPQFISTAILSACTDLAFTNMDGSEDISTLPSYVTAHVYLYFCVLLGIALFGVLINVLPVTRRFLSRTLATAEAVNSCQTTEQEVQPAEAAFSDKRPVAIDVI